MAHVPSSRTFAEVESLRSYNRITPHTVEQYTKLCRQNDAMDGISKHEPTMFYSTEMPLVSVNDFLVRLTKYAHSSNQVFVVMKIFMDRYVQRTGMIVNSRSVHRLALTCFVLAAKLRDDVYYTNSYYACIGGLPTFKLNLMERAVLIGLDFDITVSRQQFEQTLAAVPAQMHRQPSWQQHADAEQLQSAEGVDVSRAYSSTSSRRGWGTAGRRSHTTQQQQQQQVLWPSRDRRGSGGSSQRPQYRRTGKAAGATLRQEMQPCTDDLGGR
eukprot:TRINITY_DN2684_c0_g2_i2.p2 TRINITY_DN2684_c0_g2~~TRINITY_DN2684_c0_g2_i2.p2  ORF type:complete len:302 (+),score=105.42 TRINITY_DN2684_c0_g2_i2:98-907(+)